jgi:GNAT superfamily N-acetyltransferase
MAATDLEISVPAPADGEHILGLARRIILFDAQDVEIIQELWTEFASKGEQGWYRFLVARQGKEIRGFAAYGRRPLTEATFDLYWLGTDQAFQGQGIGKKLLRRVEEEVRKLGGKLLIIETEGRREFEPTRQFYLHAGCEPEARIRDFYAPGNDLVIFTVHL